MTSAARVSLHLSEYAPTHAPIGTSRGAHLGRPTLLLGLDGLGEGSLGEVWAEACPLPAFGAVKDDFDRARAELSSLDPVLVASWLQKSPLAALAAAFEVTGQLRSAAARHAIEWVVLRAVARLQNRTPTELVQAWLERRGAIWPGPRQVLPASTVLDLLDPELTKRARESHERGIRTFKLKCGRDQAREEVALEELARALGPARLRLDPGGVWARAQALDFVRAVQEICASSRLSLELVEDPTTDPDEWAEIAALAPLAADEILAQADVGRDFSTSFWVLKPMVHGVARLLELAQLGHARGQHLLISHAFDGPFAFSAAVALACVVQTHEHAAGLGPHPGIEAWTPELMAHGRILRGSRLGPRAGRQEFLLDGGHVARVTISLSATRAAAQHRERPFLDLGERVVRFAELGAARSKPAPGGAPGFVPILAQPTEAAILDLLAALEHGVPALLLHPSSTEASRKSMIERCKRHAGELGPGDALIVPTSGSTGEPHLVVHTHASLAAALSASAARLGAPGPSTRWLLSLPLSHVGGVSILLRCLSGGACVVVRPLPRVPAEVRRLLDDFRVTHLSVVPTQLERWLAEPSFRFPPSVECVLVGGAPVSQPLRARLAERGVPACFTYGLTEMGSQVATEGRLLREVELAIGDDGRLRLGGPMLMRRYLGELAPITGGLLLTSDLGRIEHDGRLTILGRQDDMIISGGENVTPNVVLAALSGVLGVRELVVLGLPSPEWGHEVAAAVVAARGYSIPELEAELRAVARSRLAPFAQPKSYHFLTDLPVLASGKVDRRRLAERLAALRTG